MKQPQSERIWALPLLLNVAAAVGLVAALVGDGLWDAASWLALCAPLVILSRRLCRVRSERVPIDGRA